MLLLDVDPGFLSVFLVVALLAVQVVFGRVELRPYKQVELVSVAVVAVQGLDIPIVEFPPAGTASDAIPPFAERTADNSSEQRLIVGDVQMG